MAQKMLDEYNAKILKLNSKSTQTSDDHELCITLSKTKKIHLYKSKAYKSYVISFDLGSSKKFIITKEKWLLFRNHIEYIDEIMTNKEII
jgi:hypothetical protein